MERTFSAKVSRLAILVGSIFLVVLAAFGYSLVTTMRADDEALTTYAEELMHSRALQEAVQRKMASGRGYLLSRSETLHQAFDKAVDDELAQIAILRARVESKEGVRLLEAAIRDIEAHDKALRSVMAMEGVETAYVAQQWVSRVAPLATTVRADLDALIHYKEALYGDAKAHALGVQLRAKVVSISTALAALLVGFLGSSMLIRSARMSFATETEARAAAERERAFFTNLLDQLPIGILAAEVPSGRIVLASNWARDLLSIEQPRATDLYSSLPIRHLDGTPYAERDRPLARAMRGEVIQGEEVSCENERILAITAGPIRDDTGKIVAAVVAFTDVTDRKTAEKERELFLGALGHDLRNPLNTISLAASSLTRRTDLPEIALKPAARIAASAERMARLIGDLLDFARSQSGDIPVDPQPCRLSEVAQDIVAEIKVTHPDREIRVKAQGGCEGRWDRGRMAQVFQNLVANAVDHGKADQPVEVITGCSEDVVFAQVTNRGPTIPPEERAKIFEPFRRSGSSKGLGLGLYVARAIVEAHGGKIHVESQDGETTFTLVLPREAREPVLPS